MPVTGDSRDRSDPGSGLAPLPWVRSAEGVETPTVPMVRKHEEAGAPILKAVRFKPSAPPHVTPEGIALKPAYGAEDIAGLDQVDSWPGLAPICAAPTPPCTSPSVDHPAAALHAEESRSTAATWHRARWVCRWRSICRRIAAMTAIIRGLPAMSAWRCRHRSDHRHEGLFDGIRSSACRCR